MIVVVYPNYYTTTCFQTLFFLLGNEKKIKKWHVIFNKYIYLVKSQAALSR